MKYIDLAIETLCYSVKPQPHPKRFDETTCM
jgi:hypothetical protein